MPGGVIARIGQGRQFIGGRWRRDTVSYFENINPANTAEMLGEYPRGTAADVDDAVSAARKAFGSWRKTSRIRRGELFLNLANLIRRDTDELAAVLARENGKVLNEARAEVVEGLHMVEYVFGMARQPTGQVIDSEVEAKDLYVRRKPRGVVGVITPWNFPFAVPLWMLGPSLLEGNTTVFKPSEETPEIGERLVQLFEEAGFPPGTINLVHGVGEEAGDALARHAGVDVVAFTGSYQVGAHIRRLAAEADHKTCALEMGSKSAVIVCEDADVPLAVNAALFERLQDDRPALCVRRAHAGASQPARSLCRAIRRASQALEVRRSFRSDRLCRPHDQPGRRRQGAGIQRAGAPRGGADPA